MGPMNIQHLFKCARYAIAAVVLITGAGVVSADPIEYNFGAVLGDSYSAEYQFAARRDNHRNFVEQLAFSGSRTESPNGGTSVTYGGIGAITTDPPFSNSVPGYIWANTASKPLPREDGFNLDLARSGATTFNAITGDWSDQGLSNDGRSQLELALDLNSDTGGQWFAGGEGSSGDPLPGDNQLVNYHLISLGVNDMDFVHSKSGNSVTQVQGDAVADAVFANIKAIVEGGQYFRIDDSGSGPVVAAGVDTIGAVAPNSLPEGLLSSNITSAESGETQLVLSTVVDLTLWPSRDSTGSEQKGDSNKAITEASTARLNEKLKDYAITKGVALIDQQALLEDLMAGTVERTDVGVAGVRDAYLVDPANGLTTAMDKDGNTVAAIKLAGQKVIIDPDVQEQDNNPANYLWADASHVGSVYHGILGNVFLTALELAYGVEVTSDQYLTFDEIFATADTADYTNGATNLFGAADGGFNFDYAAYVTVIPEPGTAALLLAGSGLILSAGRRRRAN